MTGGQRTREISWVITYKSIIYSLHFTSSHSQDSFYLSCCLFAVLSLLVLVEVDVHADTNIGRDFSGNVFAYLLACLLACFLRASSSDIIYLSVFVDVGSAYPVKNMRILKKGTKKLQEVINFTRNNLYIKFSDLFSLIRVQKYV